MIEALIAYRLAFFRNCASDDGECNDCFDGDGFDNVDSDIDDL